MNDLWQNRNWTPMLLEEVSAPFDSKEYIYELKFDGTRTILFANKTSVTIYNRRKQDITYLYPELQSIKNLVKHNTIFDGEIIALENGLPSFNKLQKRAHLKNKKKIQIQSQNNPVIFICYDLLYANKNLITKPLIKRKTLLSKYPENDEFAISKYIEEQGTKLYQKVLNLNLEGIVAKKKDSLYQINKRTDSWLKIKNLHNEDFLIGGFITKENNYVISLIIGEYRNKKFHYVAKVTLGKKTKLYHQLLTKKPISKSPFCDYDNNNATFINPTLKCSVNYMERTKNNHLRQPFIRH